LPFLSILDTYQARLALYKYDSVKRHSIRAPVEMNISGRRRNLAQEWSNVYAPGRLLIPLETARVWLGRRKDPVASMSELRGGGT
jgi:hypothetical protein